MPLERYRNIEFQRNWNIEQNLKVQENLGLAGLKLRTIKNTFLAYQLSFYNQDSLYNGFEHLVSAGYKQKGWNTLAELKWLDSKSQTQKTLK